MITDISQRLAIAVVGGGEGATKAITALSSFPLLDLKAVVCEPQELGGLIESSRRVTKYRDVLDRSDIKAVYIATPNGTHIPLALKAIQAGKHVLIEKPLGLSIRDVDQLRAYEDRGILIAVAFKKRFGAGFQHLYRTYSTTSSRANACFRWHIPPPHSSWHYDSKISGGGVIMDLGSHVFDLLECLLGSICGVDTQVQMSDRARDIEDEACITLQFKSGSKGCVELSWTSKIACQQLSLQFEDTEISFRRVTRRQDVVSHRSPEGLSEYTFDPSSEYEGLFKQFCNAIWTGDSSVPTLQAGLRNHVILEAVYKSAKDGRPVYVYEE